MAAEDHGHRAEERQRALDLVKVPAHVSDDSYGAPLAYMTTVTQQAYPGPRLALMFRRRREKPVTAGVDRTRRRVSRAY